MSKNPEGKAFLAIFQASERLRNTDKENTYLTAYGQY
jgi:hypothetical protein